jgi:hypothetical protein
MSTRAVLSILLVTVLTTWAATSAFTDDEKKPLSRAELEAKVMQLSGKCPMHDKLQQLVGNWTVSGTYHSTMGAFPVSGKAENKAEFDGRFLALAYEGPGMAGTLYGEGHMGYNRLANRFERTWLMSAWTGISTMSGTYDEETRTFRFTGKEGMPDGTTWTMRQELKFESDDKYTERNYSAPPGGKEQLELELTYTRTPKADDSK